MRVLVVLVGIVVLLSGCISAQTDLESDAGDSGDGDAGGSAEAGAATSWSWSSGGYTTSDQSGQVDAPSGSAHLSLSAGGSGDATVTVRDAAGTVVYERDVDTDGGTSDSRTLRGAPGTWTVTVDMSSWSGGFAIDIHGQ